MAKLKKIKGFKPKGFKDLLKLPVEKIKEQKIHEKF
jgi:hypothetical protein